jgi:hypothetical protein
MMDRSSGFELPRKAGKVRKMNSVEWVVKTIGGLLMMISFFVVGNLFMKLGAMTPSEQRLFSFVHWKTLSGLTALAAAAYIYTWPLSLSAAKSRSVIRSRFMHCILASALILADPESLARWIGIYTDWNRHHCNSGQLH